MLSFSQDPAVAERQMEAILFSLTTFGYIDGEFDDTERGFIRDYIGRLVARRVETGMPDATEGIRADLVTRFTRHFIEKFENIDAHVRELFNEPIAKDDDRDAFVHAKLKQRCFEIFQAFDQENQEAILDTVDAFIMADGHAHPAETKFRAELAALLSTDLDLAVEEGDDRQSRANITPPVKRPGGEDHPFFRQFEFHYSKERAKIQKQIGEDLRLIDRFVEGLEAERAAGRGRLAEATTVDDLSPGSRFLDGWVHILRPAHKTRYELTVLGDLHGCYSCLKAAVMQSRFFEKIEAYRRETTRNPYPILVLLGDYIDRGIFSLNGVLRTVLQMAVTAPEHVVVLRGNHEYYLEYQGQIYGGVKPAEAIDTLKPHLPVDVFREYMRLFDAMPGTFIFDRVLFTHGGIPRDRVIKDVFTGLDSLNHDDIRFQMMWSDPSAADVIPLSLQEQTARFPFGRLQFQSFMRRLGCTTLIRGHEKVEEGFRRVYDDEKGLLITLFSAGGADNQDLPLDSSYRTVTPMALTLSHGPSSTDQPATQTMTPFEIDWRSYNDPERNAFFKAPMEIEHRSQ